MPTPQTRAPRRGAMLAALLMVTACTHAPETTLAFTAHSEGRRLIVSGQTSLPNEAPLLLELHKPPDMQPLADATGIVKAGRFMGIMVLPVTLPEGPYAVRVVFSPRARAWSPKVREVVGPHGERLRGPFVRQDAAGDKVLERFEPVWIGPAGV